MTDRRWLKILAAPGSPVETVTNVEIWPTDQPPTPLEPAAGTVSTYYLDGHGEAGAVLPVGPGCVRYGGAFYSPAGDLIYAPPGVDAAGRLTDQIGWPHA